MHASRHRPRYTEAVHTRLTPEQFTRLVRLAEDRGQTIGVLARDILSDEVERLDQEAGVSADYAETIVGEVVRLREEMTELLKAASDISDVQIENIRAEAEKRLPQLIDEVLGEE